MDGSGRTLGKVIAAQRSKLGMTQRELARAVNINHATISRIEGNPDIVADPSTLKAIAEALRIDYNYLLTLNRTIEDDKDIRVIARASKSMSGPEREKMMDFLRTEFAEAFKDADSDGIIDPQAPDDY
jgi:transcriptional regulator with XRE-family HTH domain